MFTTIKAIMRPRRLRSSMNLVAIMAPVGIGDPRWSRDEPACGRRTGAVPVRHGRHYEAPSRLVTCRNHASSEACTSWSRYTEIPAVDQDAVDLGYDVARRASRQGDPEAERPDLDAGAECRVPSMRARARSGSEHSTWSTNDAPASSSEIGPWRMTLPRSTMATASQVRSTSSRRCEDNTTVRPSATRERIMSRISGMPAGSSPFMGSSRISSCGSPSRQAATPRRWRMPIEYFDTLSSARWRMPTRSSDGPMRSRGRRLAGRGEDLEVLPPGQMAVEPGLVDDGPDPGQRPVAMAGHGVSEQGHGAGVGVGQPEQHPDQRGLAGAVRTQVAEGASPRDEELDAVRPRRCPRTAWSARGSRPPIGSLRPACRWNRKARPCSIFAPADNPLSRCWQAADD